MVLFKARSSIRMGAASVVTAIIIGFVAVSPAAATNFVVASIPITSATRPDPTPVDVGVDPTSGQAYVANTFDGTVSVIDTETNRVVDSIPNGPASIGFGPTAVAVDEAGRKVYVANYNSHTVSVIDIQKNRVSRVIPYDPAIGIGKGPSDIALDPDLQRAYVSNLIDGTVSVIDTKSDSVVKVIPHDPVKGVGSFLLGIAVDTGLHSAYVTNGTEGTVSVIDTRTNSVRKVIPHDPSTGIGREPREVAVDSVTHQAFVTNSGDDSVSIVDTRTDAVTAVLPHDEMNGITAGSWSVEVDSAGGQFLVASDKRIVAIDAASHRVTRLIDKSSSSDYGYGVQGMAVDPAHRVAYIAGSTSDTVAAVDLDTTAALSRLSGSDRFASSAAVSRQEFAAAGDVVYVASGAAFPDALSGSAAAGLRGAPVLLVSKDTIPTSVGSELARLKPKKIILLGGPASVDTEVERALNGYAPVTRLGGADRYAVSAAVSKDYFAPAVPVAYVASGENFPDALSGAATAPRSSAPVLLVTHDGIPASVETELARLKPGRIVVLGGINTINNSVVSKLTATAPTTRLSGSDRFSGSAAISADAYPAGADTVFVAAGATFPDALSGGSAAAANGAPILLVQTDSVPPAVASEIRRLGAKRIVVLGGENSISPAAYAQLRALLS